MARFFLRRMALIPLVLLLVNFAGFAFAHVTFQLQQLQTIYGSGREGITPVWPEYSAYLSRAIQGDIGQMPTGGRQPIAARIGQALASLGLLAVAFMISSLLGLALGLLSVRLDPPRTMPWLALASTAGLAMPGFYLGTLLVGGLLLLVSSGSSTTFLPVSGFGWDAHLLLPVLALIIRPTMQVAQVASALMAAELGNRYITTARSTGHSWSAIRWDKALRNILAPLLLTLAGSFRLLVTDLVLVEWLFLWPGLGRLLVQALVPPKISSLGGLVDTSVYFLNPPLVAALLVVFALLFLLADTLASGLAGAVDPRLRITEEEAARG